MTAWAGKVTSTPDLRIASPSSRLLILAVILSTLVIYKIYANAIGDDMASRKSAMDTRNVEGAIEQLLAQLTLQEKISLCHANSKFAIAGVERLGIPEMWMSDGPHGVREEISRDSWNPAGWDNDHATYLPVLTAVAASFNPEMATLHGSVLGAEARERGKDVILGPGVNLARNPLYGRNFEYMGEDPFLASVMVVPEIIAIQKNDVAACAKHYALNNQELNRKGVNTQPDERTLREIYLPAFEAAVKAAGVLTMMGAYNEFRGTNCNQSKHLVLDILKGEWGYKGLLMTDWDCDINTHDAAMNGLDVEMGTEKPTYNQYYLADAFLQELKQGTIPIEVIDDKIRRILRVQLAIGMMDQNRMLGSRNTDEHHQKARQIIEEGVVLLKNKNGMLPLDQKNTKRILVLGPNADLAHGYGGGSSMVKSLFEITPLEGLRKKLGSQVEITYLKAAPPKADGLHPISPDYVVTKDSGSGTPAWKNLIYPDASQQKNSDFKWATTSTLTFDDGEIHHERLTAEIQPVKSGKHTFQIQADGGYDLAVDGKSILKVESTSPEEIKTVDAELEAGVTYSIRLIYNGTKGCTLGWNAPGDLYVDAEVYLAAAKEADAVIYFAGLNHGLDREAEDRPDMKLPGAQDHAITQLAQVNPNTVVFMIAGSAVEMPWVDQVGSIVWGWYGGMFAGNAYADILFGDVVPSGKLPITLPKSLADNPHVVLDDYNAEDCFYKEGVFMGYRWFDKKQIEPLFPFGHGLSYTSFQYSDLKLSKPTMEQDENLTISFAVKNSGERDGAEVVQLYVQDVESSVERPAKELKGFTKVFLEAGKSTNVELKISKKELSFWDVKSEQWLAEPGVFKVHLGSSSDDLRLQGECSLN